MNAIDRQPLDFLLKAQRRHGDVIRLRLGHMPTHLVVHPQGVAHVLADNNRNYSKSTRLYATLKLLMGDGLINSENSFWLRQRRIMQPAFHRQRLKSFGNLMVRATEEMLEQWRNLRQPFDVHEQLLQLILRISSDILLGSTTALDADVLNSASTFSNKYIYARARSVFPLPLWVPTRENRAFKRHLAALDELVYRMIATRRKAGARADEASDLLSLLMAVRDEDTGECMTDQQVRDEVVTIMVAAHETTGNALAWALHLLNEHPDVAARLRTEVDGVLGSGPFDPDALVRMPYVRQVVDEVLRLYPPAWISTRVAREDDEIGGYHIPKGSLVLITPYVSHRHPTIWPQPEHFDPARFAQGQGATRPKHAYIPFGLGPRQCIGNNLALMEMQIILVSLVRAVELRGVPGRRVVAQPHFTLGPKDGLWITCTFRQRPVVNAGSANTNDRSSTTHSSL